MSYTQIKLSKKKTADDKHQVIVRVSVSRSVRPSFDSGIFVRPSWFKDVEGSYEIAVPKMSKLNQAEVLEARKAKGDLESFRNKALHFCEMLYQHDEAMVTKENVSKCLLEFQSVRFETVDVNALLEVINRADDEADAESFPTDIVSVMLAYSEAHSDKPRMKHMKVLARALARFIMFVRLTDGKQRNYSIDINTATKEDMESFFDYYKNENALSMEYPAIFEKILKQLPIETRAVRKVQKIEERGCNTMVSMRKLMRSFFLGIKDKTTNDPMRDVPVEKEYYTTPYYLTREERDKIYTSDIDNDSLAIQRDIFIFQCLVGCRVGDFMRLKGANVIGGTLRYIARKTMEESQDEILVPLTPTALEILERYKSSDDEPLLPFISEQKYNVAIKKVLTVCGVTRKVTVLDTLTKTDTLKPINEVASSHMARRTFVGLLYSKVKDPEIIAKMSGHTEGSRAFRRYRKITEEDLRDTMSLID